MKITAVKAIPLTMPIEPGEHRTWWGDYPSVSIVMVEVTTDAGIKGYGESLARLCPQAYAAFINNLLGPKFLGGDPLEIEKLWQAAFRTFRGRSGGILLEALSGIDIALWDIAGKATGQPVHRLLGSMGRKRVTAYASSISWAAEETAFRQIEAATAAGYRMLKLKLGAPVEDALAWCRRVRDLVPAHVKLCADANAAYDLDDAIKVSRGLLDLDFYWLEEPLVPEDAQGYRALRAAVPLRLAGGEGEYTAYNARAHIAERGVGVIQPDAARAGGITEARRIAGLAYAFHVGYAPHVGAGGVISAAANLQLAASAPNFLTFESMIFPSPLRQDLATTQVGDVGPDGLVAVPEGPGLGIEINFDTVERLRSD